MNPHVTNSTPGIIVLAAALCGAILFLLTQKKTSEAAKKTSEEDLDTRYQAMLGALKEHAAAKHLLPEAEWQAEQSRLETAAAAVLREKAGLKHEATKAQARAEKLAAAQTPQVHANATLRGALIGGVVVGFFVLLGMVLTQQTQPRAEKDGMTGANPSAEGGRPPMMQGPDPAKEVERLRKLAEAHPEDIEVLSDVAGQMIKLQAFNDAYPIVTRASGIDPFHVQTRIWRAVLDAVDGQALTAIDELEHLGDTYDGAYKARLYAGLIELESDQPQRALKQLEAYLVEAPAAEQPPFVAMSVAQLKAQLNAQRQAKGP